MPPASAATMLRFAGNCTTAISVTALDAVHIELELRLLPRRLPREGAMTIFCRWRRSSTALFDLRHVDLTRSSSPPPERPGALVDALLGALRSASIDASDDDALQAALHGAIVTSRVHLIEDAVLVVDTNSDGVIQAAACRVQPMPVIVRFLPVLQ